MTAMSKREARDLRPSTVIAEALVDRHGPTEIVDRARELGFSRGLTQAVVAACCRTGAPHDPQPNTPRPQQNFPS